MININDIAKKINLTEEELYKYGKYIAKIDKKMPESKDGKLILVTSTSPTMYGEGKTTLAIGLCDLLNYMDKKSIVVLREPSLGPVFGTKGGATGGGCSKVVPEEEINLHFTSDMHAITSANNLICSVIDNILYHDNELNLDKDKIVFNRCLDINDRALREVYLKVVDRKEKFNITAASEIMSVLCLSNDMEELRSNIDNIIVGYTKDNKEVYVKDLECTGAVLVLLKNAFKPNLVQTLNGNPAIIHGGPFANIAHGCNSLISTKLAMKLSEYTIVEAGFGSDMGALKFFDIKCKKGNIYPNLVIINTTIKSLKYNGNDEIEKGIDNLKFHIENMKRFTDNILVLLNKFDDDRESDIDYVRNYLDNINISFEVSNLYNGNFDESTIIAEKIITMCENKCERKSLYDTSDDIYEKINILCKEVLHAGNVIIDEKVKTKLDFINNNFRNLPVCISKNPTSISGNSKLLGYPKDYDLKITDVEIKNGAGFIVVHIGNVITMPGLSNNANYKSIDLNKDDIVGVIK